MNWVFAKDILMVELKGSLMVAYLATLMDQKKVALTVEPKAAG